MKRTLARIKRWLITLGGLRKTFALDLLGTSLRVDYNLRPSKADRDYNIILQMAKGKKGVLDVGANHGLISMLIARQNPDAKIYAIEASEDAVNIINQNVALNAMSSQITTINSLVADKSGYTIPFYWQGSSGGASMTKDRLGHTIEIEKSTLSVDDYVQFRNLKPDFIKMDIEGAEYLAIRGMSHVLDCIKPDIFVELHSFGELSLVQNAKSILDSIYPFNYVMIYLRTGNLIDDVSVLSDRGRCHVVLMPIKRYSREFVNNLDLSGL